MDRLIFTALNTIQYAQEDNVIRSNNLANATVPGFRHDLSLKKSAQGFWRRSKSSRQGPFQFVRA